MSVQSYLNILPTEIKIYLMQFLHLKHILTLSKVSIDLCNIVYADKLYIAYKKIINEVNKICASADYNNSNSFFF